MKSKIDLLWQKTHFVKSALNPKEFPRLLNAKGKPLFEVALVGRSNVGKSSLLNHLAGSKVLAKTSSTPGKTQLINFFSIDDLLSIVDLPGYGFAKASFEHKEKWHKAIESYLKARKELKLIILLIDIRRMLTDDDLLFLEWARYYQKELLIVFTKVDKASITEKKKNSQEVLSALSDIAPNWVYYSTKTNEGCNELRKIVVEYATN